MRNRIHLLVGIVATLLLTACDQRADVKILEYSSAPAGTLVPVYRLLPHPLYNPQTLAKLFQPLVDYLNNHLPDARIELEASRDYQVFEQKFRAREAEILMPNPWQTLEAIKVGYGVIAMWGDAEDFKGIFIIRRDSGIQKPGDLNGKAVSYPSPTALAAAIMPQYYLYQHGININKDVQNRYVGSQESSIMSVYMGDTAAGATWPPPWRLFQKDHPVEAAQLKLAWETPPLVNNSVMVRGDVPVAVRAGLKKALLDLHNTPVGKKILADLQTARFHDADDASYEAVREFIARFEQQVRPIERK